MGTLFVHFNHSIGKLVIANSEGLMKILNTNDPESQPISIDILDNLTSLSSHEDKSIVLTTTEGKLELIDLSTNTSKGVLYRSELPLRDTVFINQETEYYVEEMRINWLLLIYKPLVKKIVTIKLALFHYLIK